MTEATNPKHREGEPIVLDYDLDEAPEKVWRALTDPVLVAAWLAPNDIAANEAGVEAGARFLLRPAPETPIECEVLESEPSRRLSYSWRETPEHGRPLDSVVTFEITPQPGGGSHLRLVHRALEIAGAGGLVSASFANDNCEFKGWSLAWAA
jgi:uncharacterized protein YndB with AHSA1/START domain